MTNESRHLPALSNVMRMLASLLILLSLALSTSCVALAQEMSLIDRQKLKQAERTADRFVERYRQTLDFGTVWKEFQVSDASCNYKLNGPWNEEDYERLKLNDVSIERLYVAYMNCFYLSFAYRLSVLHATEDADDERAAEKRLPNEIRMAERKLLNIGGRTRPQNTKEVEEEVAELQQLARIWRKHMPHNVMRSVAWRANVKNALRREGIGHLGVGTGGEWTLCIPDGVKYYYVDRGLFYFYFVEEKGRMKVVRFGMGD